MAVAQKQRDGPPISSLMVPVPDLEYELRFFSDIVRPSRMKKRATPPKTKEKLFQKGTSGSGFNTTTAKQAVNKAEKLKKSLSIKRKRTTVNSSYDTSKAQSSVLQQAKEVQANLDPKFPSLVKSMLPSHVTFGFWLGLPKHFCDAHLPKHDTKIVLEDESGEEFETKYLWLKVGLSAGWRGFSIAHKILVGDIVIFHLVKPSKFKVYIVRSNSSDEVDGALALLKLDTCMKQMNCNTKTNACEETVNEGLEPLSQENTMDLGPISDPLEDHSDFGSEILDGIKLSESVVDFKNVRSIEGFIILVNGLVINSELPKFLLTKYYELCCSQKSFLHEYLLEGLNCKLAAGIISETINIADAIRSCKICTSLDHFSTWEKTLKAFEVLGMNVGFLHARLDQLVNISLKSKRYKEARLERDHAEEEKQTLEAKLLEIKERMNCLDAEIENLDPTAEGLELMFEELANAPW